MMTSETLLALLLVGCLVSIYTSSGEIPNPYGRPCYENLCWCRNNTANCSGNHDRLTYIPKLRSECAITIFLFQNNYLPYIGHNTFENLTTLNLKHLNLVHSNISHVSEQAFRKLTKLQSLSLSHNPLILTKLAAAFHSLASTLSYIYLNHIGISDSDLEENLLKGLQKSPITGIHLVGNNLAKFNFSHFSGFPELTTLNLNSNTIRIYPDNFNRVFSKTLASLWISHNNITSMPDFCSNGKSAFPNLYTLRIGYNQISYLNKSSFGCLRMCTGLCLTHLHISGNPIQVIGSETFSSFKSLQKLIMKQLSSPQTDIDDEAFIGCNSLNHLDLSDNNITAEKLDHLLRPLHKTLNYLNCTNCSLQKMPDVISDLAELKDIFLGYNDISFIRKNMFVNNIKLLNMSLCHNNLSYLLIPNSIRSRLVYANIEGNPFNCDCDLLWLRNWLVKARSLFSRRLSFYTCFSPPETKGQRLVDVQSVTYYECVYDRKYVFLVVGVVVAVLMCLLCFALGYKWRWDIRYFLVWKRRTRSSSSESIPLLMSDVYLLYSDEDFVWVRHQALPNLEDKGRLRICFRSRDFDPKIHIMDSIVKNLNGCRKVLMIVSTSFCKDIGCQFELSLVQKRLEDPHEAFVVVLLEDIDDRYMSEFLSRLLQDCRVMTWSGRGGNEDEFWNQVLLMLNRSDELHTM
ncbi:toll-like receptor 13 [Haliotis rufescens]|uniref:toll-like receptor 13 n=1 Tax=Haliotis rufescens TaxID=6454 RepID=UPI00201F440D|nr:toll-like receptor 13 [Haliotis rufescens]XP_046356296.2 toll-like receptor 13 [Haliotis rufescens]XP_046356298.2 toll-like receptor 13 [Haliotis rufescens]XP_046356299.2 toll-like receptor 13 [Haliotis rufescens]XP_046356301.2 toll-like receptor 13 [Haliotis rufescens]XP_046356302.2 toll-like receptor 13 [Haliotis rufescens]XP_046356303.2 toll-like receptor 13 [Haliotis rufescens]